ncbi:MAG: hypothetical protein H0X70_07730 [Segetibacter sp.]|nr:hypothetical protein [Segetibacter sp.]
MKKIYIFSFLLITYSSLHAQNYLRSFHLDKPVNMAAILARKVPPVIGFSTVSEARTIISDIMDVAEIQQNFKVVSTTQVDNAAAVIYQNQRYILYNASFINQLDNAANDKWASISVLGHEIGHHLLGHTLDGTGSQIPKELAADEFSGLVLRRMGASLQQAQLAMQLIASPNASATHPGERDRLAAIARGWNNTTTLTNRSNRDVAIEYPTNDGRTTYPSPNYPNYPQDRTSRESYPGTNDPRGNYPDRNYPNYPQTQNERRNYPGTNDSRSNYPDYPGRRGNTATTQTIDYDVKFNRSNGEQYFITSQNNVIRYRGNRFYSVAKIALTNRSDFPYVIYDDQTQLYVDRKGNIYSDNRQYVGRIIPHR